MVPSLGMTMEQTGLSSSERTFIYFNLLHLLHDLNGLKKRVCHTVTFDRSDITKSSLNPI